MAWEKLHPNTPTLPPACDDTVPVWSPPASNWHHAVMHLRDGKAVDPGGWSHEVMKTLWANPIARVPLQEWMDKMMWHLSPPEISLLHTHRLVMLTKTPAGEGVRPYPHLHHMAQAWHCCCDELHQTHGGAHLGRKAVRHRR